MSLVRIQPPSLQDSLTILSDSKDSNSNIFGEKAVLESKLLQK